MSVAIAVVMTMFANTDEVPDHARCLSVHKQWLRLNEAGGGKANLIVDPREQAMWIEVHGKVRDDFTSKLPQGYRWYAFHVTQAGIVEQSFPVRLTAPRQGEVQDDSQEEQLWVIGLGKRSSCQISFHRTRSAVAFHVGTGSLIDQVTFHLPATIPANIKSPFRSFVAPQSPRKRNPQEAIRKNRFSAIIVRQ